MSAARSVGAAGRWYDDADRRRRTDGRALEGVEPRLVAALDAVKRHLEGVGLGGCACGGVEAVEFPAVSRTRRRISPAA